MTRFGFPRDLRLEVRRSWGTALNLMALEHLGTWFFHVFFGELAGSVSKVAGSPPKMDVFTPRP